MVTPQSSVVGGQIMTFRDGELIEVNNQFAVGDAKAYVAPCSSSGRVESHRRSVDERRQAEPAATSADGGGGWWKPAGRSGGACPRHLFAETWGAAGPLRRAVAL